MWQDKLSAEFPTIKFLVCPKADSLFKIVGAASIVAKVTRDRYIEHWVDVEGPAPSASKEDENVEAEPVIRGSGYPSGTCGKPWRSLTAQIPRRRHSFANSWTLCSVIAAWCASRGRRSKSCWTRTVTRATGPTT